MSPALFLDRDGVINKNYGYVNKVEEFDFIDGIFKLTQNAAAKNYKIVIITNQAGIGRGYYSEEDFHILTKWMNLKFNENGSSIDRVYFSPYHPTAGIGKYLKDDISRKPNPGMILQAQSELNINLQDSILIGDKLTDIEAGIAAGVGLNILFSSKENTLNTNLPCKKIDSLDQANKFLIFNS